MRISLLVLFIIAFYQFALGQNADSIWVSESGKKLHINTAVKDFGVISQNEKTVFKFKLKNVEQTPLVIWHVTTSCGCTSPQWTEKPVAKDHEAVVKIKYDSSETGVFNKSIYVYTNFADKPIKLIIKGVVEDRKSASSSKTQEAT